MVERYVVRKEYFGSLIYDRNEHKFLLFDEKSTEILRNIYKNILKSKETTPNIMETLEIEEFILNGRCNYKLIDNGNYSGVLSAPTRLHLCYTQRCNLNCSHCFSKGQNKNAEREMSFEEKIKLLDEMEKIGICEVLIGGGEPLIQKDLIPFVKECKKRNIEVKIFTNGLLINDENIKEIANLDLVYLAVSIDGTTDEEYRNTRGIDGLQNVIENIRKLKKIGCKYPIVISTTINSNNSKDPEGFLNITNICGADRIKIRPTKPSGNILKNRNVMISAEDYREFLTKIQTIYNEKYSQKFKMDLTWGDLRLLYDSEKNIIFPEDTAFPYEGYGCVAGKMGMCIEADGKASPCGFLPDELRTSLEDNIVEKGIMEVWHNGKTFNFLRNIKENPQCVACEQYELCRGGCIARILFEGKKLNDKDPWCMKENLPIKL